MQDEKKELHISQEWMWLLMFIGILIVAFIFWITTKITSSKDVLDWVMGIALVLYIFFIYAIFMYRVKKGD
jgi:glucan phosphoethanolaminetransferase (alkaline phosphatase superfamily)